MWCGVVCVAGCLLMTAEAQWVYQQPDTLEENDQCHREGNDIWYCKKDTDCPSSSLILQNGGRLRTCSWQKGRIHIICCPPTRPALPYIKSISEQKCTAYQSTLCQEKRLKRQSKNESENPIFEEGTEEPTTFQVAAIGGVNANPAEHPHMTVIGYGPPNHISWQCGGSLISERFVLSAAHCSYSTSYGRARWARLGDLDIRSDTDDAKPQQFEIVQRIVHPGYRAPTYYNDIVLFRLDKPAVFDKYVRPACLHTSTEDPVGYGVATGWGKNETNGPRSSSLVKVDLKFIPVEECKQKMGILKVVLPQGLDPQTMMCAGEPGKDTCQGDSGGPLVLAERDKCLARQVGVTSFGPKNCGRAAVTGTYVRVAHFIPWIEAVVWPK